MPKYKLCPICKTKYIEENENMCWSCKSIHKQQPKDKDIPLASSDYRDKYYIDEAESDYWFDVGEGSEKPDYSYLDDIKDDEY